MTDNDSKYYRSQLNELVEQCNYTYNRSINQKPINAGYSVLT